jgi:SPP1 gp7 family putative phage head morphogenesis protein
MQKNVSTKSSKALKNKLIDASYELAVLISDIQAADSGGENWHPHYKKNRDRFRRLVTGEMRIERAMRRYFKDAAKRIVKNIDWKRYRNEVTAADKDPIEKITKSLDWEGEAIAMSIEFFEPIADIWEIGKEHAEELIGRSTGLTINDFNYQKAMKKHVLDLSEIATNTTIKRVRAAMETGFELGMPQDELAKLINKVVNDPSRAAMIARTETVQAHAKSVLETGRELNVRGKVYMAVLDSDTSKRCESLHGQEVGIDEDFISPYDGWQGEGPPAHPNCRSIVELVE